MLAWGNRMNAEAFEMDWDACIRSGALLLVATVTGGLLFEFEGDTEWLIVSIIGVANVLFGVLWTVVAALCRRPLTALMMAGLLTFGFIGISRVSDSGATFEDMLSAATEGGDIEVAAVILALCLSSIAFAFKAFSETVNRVDNMPWKK